MPKLKKSIILRLDIETHRLLERIQLAEAEKFSYPKSRRKEDLAEDILELGISEYTKTHKLKI